MNFMMAQNYSYNLYYVYRWTSLYARDRDSKNTLEFNEFEYKKIYNQCKLEDKFQKKAIFQSHISKFADKKTAYNEGRLIRKTSLWVSKSLVVIWPLN
jgi:hypothetical protein